MGAAKTKELQGVVRAIGDLEDVMRADMYRLFHAYYDAVSVEQFEADLSQKRCALLLNDSQGVLRGFTTLQVLESELNGEPVRALFSGDTIIHHDFRGEQTLPFEWLRLAGTIHAERPLQRLFWYLIVKGDKTYRYLPAFFHSFFPRWEMATPTDLQGLMHELSLRKFGDDYDPAAGVVRFPHSQGHLKPEWAEPRAGLNLRPDVRFFLEKNPGYKAGHELVCLTELTPENMRWVAKDYFQAGFLGPETSVAI